MYTGANAGAGIGGMLRFDGERWTCWNQLTYGLGYDWPFPNDFCDALAYRSSNGYVAVSPSWLYGIHDWTGSGFNQLSQGDGAERMCEDSQGRLWVLGEYYNLRYYDGNTWTSLPITGLWCKYSYFTPPSRIPTSVSPLLGGVAFDSTVEQLLLVDAVRGDLLVAST